MKNDIERLYLIDKFLKGELTGPALDEFKNRIRIEPEFSEEIESQKAIIEGIKLARKEQLISLLRGEKLIPAAVSDENMMEMAKESDDGKPVVFDEQPGREIKFRVNYNNWYYAAVAVLFAGFFAYAIYGLYYSRLNKEYVNTDSTSNSVTESPIEKSDNNTQKELPIVIAETDSVNDSLTSQATLSQDKNISPPLPGDTVKIEKDQKIAENIFKVQALEIIKATDMQKDVNVNSGDPVNKPKVGAARKVKSSSLKVEYWKSVVNFKGYKLSESKLQLFDIRPEENVSLKYLDKQLYMNKGSNYYKLVSTGNFEQYQKESNPEVVKILESN